MFDKIFKRVPKWKLESDLDFYKMSYHLYEDYHEMYTESVFEALKEGIISHKQFDEIHAKYTSKLNDYMINNIGAKTAPIFFDLFT